MRCIRRVEDIPGNLPLPCVAMGTFDGLHRGHRSVIDRVREIARTSGGSAVVVTFEPYPQEVLRPERPVARLTSFEEKRLLLGRLGVGVLLALPFDRQMAALDAETFFRDTLGPLRMKSLVVGYNFTAGRGRGGDLATLTGVGDDHGFDVAVVPPVLCGGLPVSSTRIRGAVNRGSIALANEMLGGPYGILGKVVEASGRGRALGFPTANIVSEDPAKLLPADGVYAVWVRRRDQRVCGVMNVGRRPTFGESERWVEVHLVDFRDNLYGEHLFVEVVERLRDEEVFEDEAQLRLQIGRDVEIARQLLDRERTIGDRC